MKSEKVIGNIAHLYPAKLNEVIKNLLLNTEHEETVMNWSMTFALAQIIKMKSPLNKNLIPFAESICEHEEKTAKKNLCGCFKENCKINFTMPFHIFQASATIEKNFDL